MCSHQDTYYVAEGVRCKGCGKTGRYSRHWRMVELKRIGSKDRGVPKILGWNKT